MSKLGIVILVLVAVEQPHDLGAGEQRAMISDASPLAGDRLRLLADVVHLVVVAVLRAMWRKLTFEATDWSGTSAVSQYLSVMPAQPPVAVAV